MALARDVSELTSDRRLRSMRSAAGGFLFTVPALVLLTIFLVYPVFETIRLSLDTGIFLQLQKFVGLDNYKRLFSDPYFLSLVGVPSGALVNNALWLTLYVGGCVGMGLLIAVLADKVLYEPFVKIVLFAPLSIAATATGLIWLLMYAPNPNIGVINGLLSQFGIGPIGFLGSPGLVNFAIIIAAIWSGCGLAVVVLSAGVKSIPRDILEAARIDGATPFQEFRLIVLPMMIGPLTVVTVTLLVAAIKTFDIVFVMTRGGPNGASSVIGYVFYDQVFQRGRGGYGASAAVLMLVLVLPIMVFSIRQFRLEESRR